MGEELSPDPRAKLVGMLRRRPHDRFPFVSPPSSTFGTTTATAMLKMMALSMAMLLGASGCSDTDRSSSRFCGELAVELPLLGGPFVDGADVDDLVRRYEKLDRITPLAIDQEWSALTDLIRLASDVDVDDPASRQELADTAYKAERSARDVAIWVETTCGLTMPDVVGVEGSVPVSIPVPVTEIPAIPPMPETPPDSVIATP